jgi:transglutaminase-like putative cysteine protease
MSQLYLTEAGFVVPTLGEELSRRRRARKVLDLPPTEAPGRLFILADSHPGSSRPMRVAVNGTELAPLPSASAGYRWYEIAVPDRLLRVGGNTFELWTDAEAMDAWALAVEHGRPSGGSAVSLDAGATWSGDRIGHLNTGPGEYVVRLRLAEGSDPEPPPFTAGSAHDDGSDALRALLPAVVLAPGETLARVRALATWTATAWRYRNDLEATQYAPWDPLTCLSWGKTELGHYGQPPVVMCVHYAVTFVAACVALGIPARAAVLVDHASGKSGHFVAEVWLANAGRWVMVDPNLDAMFFDGERPMTIDEIRASGDLPGRVRWGAGTAFQLERPAMRTWVRDTYLTGICFRHRAVWPRSDFLARPDETPPGHGCTAYSEADLVWMAPDVERGFAMFRYFAESAWFAEPPTW